MTTVAPPPKTVTDESNPRGIPKALFIVRLSISALVRLIEQLTAARTDYRRM